ncbi:hypothetical protein ATANTOWER_032625 [Ataeniobius toweri]|uniref:Uncharacterized protein n=1 Tax=Ataeniobius toweri TaxID=208326 RepID=A0ABU7CHJ5_9TELE|nr:hypothetical protein [Ataeniobius toweri]
MLNRKLNKRTQGSQRTITIIIIIIRKPYKVIRNQPLKELRARGENTTLGGSRENKAIRKQKEISKHDYKTQNRTSRQKVNKHKTIKPQTKSKMSKPDKNLLEASTS